MTYFLRRNGLVIKTYLRILNFIMILALPWGLYNNIKFNKKAGVGRDPWIEELKDEIETWKDGFIFGE